MADRGGMRTVLLVDDSPVARHVVARRLVAEGFAVRAESAAASAREVDPHEIDCAIIDLELGDDDGEAVATALLSRCGSLPVAFFTAGADAALRERARTRGPVFDKPDLDGILAWAKRACQPPPTK